MLARSRLSFKLPLGDTFAGLRTFQTLRPALPQLPKLPSLRHSLLPTMRNSAIFELQITPVFAHYKHVMVCLLRNCFQTFRPLLITMVMGNMLKIAAFALQFPISFYSIFFFEVFYGIMQLAVSFVFVCLFHNNISFRRMGALSLKRSGLLSRWSKS